MAHAYYYDNAARGKADATKYSHLILISGISNFYNAFHQVAQMLALEALYVQGGVTTVEFERQLSTGKRVDIVTFGSGPMRIYEVKPQSQLNTKRSQAINQISGYYSTLICELGNGAVMYGSLSYVMGQRKIFDFDNYRLYMQVKGDPTYPYLIGYSLSFAKVDPRTQTQSVPIVISNPEANTDLRKRLHNYSYGISQAAIQELQDKLVTSSVTTIAITSYAVVGGVATVYAGGLVLQSVPIVSIASNTIATYAASLNTAVNVVSATAHELIMPFLVKTADGVYKLIQAMV